MDAPNTDNASMLGDRRRSMAFVAVVALLVVAFLAAVIVRSVEPFGLDQGLFACFARWVPRGWLPYRDLFDSKPPLLFYWYALAAADAGNVLRAVWRLEAIWLGVTLVVAYAFAKHLSRSRWIGVATAALLFIGLWSPAWGGLWARAQAEEILALPMLGAAWAAWRATERTPFALLAGALTGVCGLFKIPSMAIGAAFALTWLLADEASTTSSRARIVGAARRIALLVAGCVFPWAIAVVWFAAHGALHDFGSAVLVYQRHYAAFISPPWGRVLGDFLATETLRGTVAGACAAAGIFTMIRARARELRLVAPWIAFTLAAVVAQRQLAGYHYLLAVPALAVAGGRGVVDLARIAADGKHTVRTASIVALAVVTVLVAREAMAWRDAYGVDAAFFVGRMRREEYLHRVQQGSFSPAMEEGAAEYVRAHTAPNEGVLVWGISPGIYALADRHPVTRYPFHKVLLTDAPFSRAWPGLAERRARLLDAMRADPPAYVLVGRGDANPFDPTDSLSSLMRFRELNELLMDAYHPETQIGRFIVLRRNAP